MCNSLQAPIKFVLQSERICLAGPRRAENRRNVLMKLDVFNFFVEMPRK